MAHRITILSAIILCVSILSACSVAPQQHQRTIGMQGVADTLVVPDRVVWTVKMNDLDPELTVAKQASDTKLAAVVAALADLQVDRGSVRTGATRIERQYRHCDDGSRRFCDFQVRRTLTCLQDDPAAVDAILDRLVAAADVETSYLYEVTDPEAIMKQLRLRAMDQARSKAVSLAHHAGLTVGELRSIRVQEDLNRNLHNRRQVEIDGVAGPEARLLSTQVHVNYELT